MNRQKHSAFKAIALACMLIFTAVTAHATVVNWSCDRNNGTYCIIDLDGELANLAPMGNPYMITIPENIVSGQTMTAHLQARCAVNAVNSYILKAVAKGPNGYQEDSAIVITNSQYYNPDSLFDIYDSCNRIEFSYFANGNTKIKYFKMWIPMPVHLDARDMVFNDSVRLGNSHNYVITLNTFLTWADKRDITITLLNDSTTNYSDFAVVRGQINPSRRCGRPAPMDRFFVNTNDPSNQFIVRFTPSAAGVRTARFVISNGRGNEDTITVTANGYIPSTPTTPVCNLRLLQSGKMGHAYNIGKRIYHQGDTATIKAIPGRGFIFLGWSDGTRNATYSFVINQDTTLVPYFAKADEVFHFTAMQDSAAIKFANLNMTSAIGLIYSDNDGQTWNIFDIDSTKTILARGDRLYVRADSFNMRFSNILSDGSIEGYHFETDSTAVEGNIMYLLNSRGMGTYLPDTAFAGLFNGANIVYADKLTLPAAVTPACYYGMFLNCSALQIAPMLPATRLVNHCYSNMFRNCTSLHNIKVAFTRWNEADSATFNWVNNVDTTGLFVAPAPLPQIVDSTHIPYNWISGPVRLNYRSQNIFMGYVVAMDAATGTIIRSGDMVPRGTDVVMMAVPAPGYAFVHWVSMGSTRIPRMNSVDTIKMLRTTNLMAVFCRMPHPHHIIMEEGEESDTETITEATPELDIYTEGTTIIISGAEDSVVNIYDASGRLVKTTTDCSNPIDVNIPGVYFIQAGMQPATRVVVK